MKKIKFSRWIFLLIVAMLACSIIGQLPNSLSSDALTIQLISSLERIGQTASLRSSPLINIFAARGEYESFQLVVRAPQNGLTNVNVKVSNFYGSGNQIIPQANITLYREHYVQVQRASPSWRGMINRSLGVGWYADGLIPFLDPGAQKSSLESNFKAVPFDIQPQSNQPIWVDIFVPRNAQAGRYIGKVTVTSNQGKIETQVSLKVWNFSLPLKPSLRSSFDFWQVKTKQANEELLKHKLMPKQSQSKDQSDLMKQGLTSASLGYWSGANNKTCTMRSAPSVETFRAKAAQYQSGLLRYNYTADEIDSCPSLYEPMKQWAKNLHQAGVNNLVTMTPTPILYDDASGTGRSAVDIWVLLPKMYDEARDRVSQVLQKGDQVWSYNALVQDDYSPKWEIDFAPINFRIQPGFISQSLKLTGILYWRLDLWTKDPWHDVQTYQTNAQGQRRDYPGEGMLVYPGKPLGIEGIVPSMRLKWLRDGVEDYEYVEILKGLGRGDWALSEARRVGQDWQHWTTDPQALEAVRQRLGEEIDRIAFS